MWFNEMLVKDKENQKKERWEKIGDSKENRYKEVKGEGIPNYLKNDWRENRWRRVVRFRLGKQ